jgi:hypothetical protein
MSASPLHPLTRLTRVAVALVTVWCLGCGAFEPLVANLTGATISGMNCGSEQTTPSPPLEVGSGAAAEGIGSSEVQAVVAVDGHEQGYSCGCESCCSVSPTRISFALPHAAAPEVIQETVAFFESTKREPLVPPPQVLS